MQKTNLFDLLHTFTGLGHWLSKLPHQKRHLLATPSEQRYLSRLIGCHSQRTIQLSQPIRKWFRTPAFDPFIGSRRCCLIRRGVRGHGVCSGLQAWLK